MVQVVFKRTLISSQPLTIKCGVSHGSVLVPVLFLLYIYLNDIHRVSNLLKFHLFTDDTSLLFPHKEEHVIEEIVKQEHKQVNNWISENKISLNV